MYYSWLCCLLIVNILHVCRTLVFASLGSKITVVVKCFECKCSARRISTFTSTSLLYVAFSNCTVITSLVYILLKLKALTLQYQRRRGVISSGFLLTPHMWTCHTCVVLVDILYITIRSLTCSDNMPN